MSDTPKAWMVRGGREPDRIFEKYAIDNGFAIIGWHLSNLTKISRFEKEARKELKRLYRIAHPEVDSNISIGISASQIYRFLSIRESDLIVMPMKGMVALGIVEGSYVYEDRYFDQPEAWPKGWHLQDGRHRVPVRWMKTDIKESDLGENAVSFLSRYKRNTVAQFDDKSTIDLRQFLRVVSGTEIISRQYKGGLEYRAPTWQEMVDKQTVFEVNPALRERGNKAHLDIQNELAKIVRFAELQPRRPRSGDPQFDVAWQRGDTAFVAEVKSVTEENEERQLRLGLGQVLSYAHLLDWHGVESVQPVLAVERRPAAEYWEALCKKHDVILTWPEEFERLFD